MLSTAADSFTSSELIKGVGAYLGFHAHGNTHVQTSVQPLTIQQKLQQGQTKDINKLA